MLGLLLLGPHFLIQPKVHNQFYFEYPILHLISIHLYLQENLPLFGIFDPFSKLVNCLEMGLAIQ